MTWLGAKAWKFGEGVVPRRATGFVLSVAAGWLLASLWVPVAALSPAEMAPRPGPRFWTGDIPAGSVVFCGDWALGQSGYFCCAPTGSGCGDASGVAVEVR